MHKKLVRKIYLHLCNNIYMNMILPVEQPWNTNGTTTEQPRNYNGTAAEQPRNTNGTAAEVDLTPGTLAEHL